MAGSCAPVRSSGGMSPAHPRFTHSAIRRLREFRAPAVSVDWLDFEEAFERYPRHFMYLDPPYWNEQALYGQRGDAHQGFDHERLCELLKRRRAGWMLSYNDSPRVRELYDGCRMVTPVWSYGMANVKAAREKRVRVKPARELLIFPEAERRLAALPAG